VGAWSWQEYCKAGKGQCDVRYVSQSMINRAFFHRAYPRPAIVGVFIYTSSCVLKASARLCALNPSFSRWNDRETIPDPG
jgi:hypothetical protein